MQELRYSIPGIPVVLRRKAPGQVWTARIKRDAHSGSDFGRVERSTGYHDLESAIGAAHKLYASALEEKSLRQSSSGAMTFGQVAAEFLEREKEKAEAGRISMSRYEREKIALRRHFIPGLGQHVIAEITEDDVDAFLTKRKQNSHLEGDGSEIIYERAGRTLRYRRRIQNASNESLRRERTVFNAVIRYAIARKYIERERKPSYPGIASDPERNRRPDFSPEAIVHLQRISIERILGTKNPYHRRQRLMCHLRMLWIYLTGMRPQEVALVRHRDIEIDEDKQGKRAVIIDLRDAVRLKNPKHRREVVALSEFSLILFQTYFDGCGYGPEDYLFPGTRRRPLGTSNKIFKELVRVAAESREGYHTWEFKFDPRSPYYSLRHTFITERIYEGWDIGKLARHCGTSAEMIERFYSHVVSRVERTSSRLNPGPYLVSLPSEIWGNKDSGPAVFDFEPDFRYQDY